MFELFEQYWRNRRVGTLPHRVYPGDVVDFYVRSLIAGKKDRFQKQDITDVIPRLLTEKSIKLLRFEYAPTPSGLSSGSIAYDLEWKTEEGFFATYDRREFLITPAGAEHAKEEVKKYCSNDPQGAIKLAELLGQPIDLLIERR